MRRRPPKSTRTYTLLPYTPLFRTDRLSATVRSGHTDRSQGILPRPVPPGSLDAGTRTSIAHTNPRNQDVHRRRGQRGGAQLYTAGGLALVVARDAASAQPSLGGYAIPQRAN